MVDSLDSSIKETVSKINTEALASLNIKGKLPIELLMSIIKELAYLE
jgi:hypothetical protein